MYRYIKSTDDLYGGGYCAGRIEDDGTMDFYYDTRFSTYEQAAAWGVNHDCTHIYDAVNDVYCRI